MSRRVLSTVLSNCRSSVVNSLAPNLWFAAENNQLPLVPHSSEHLRTPCSNNTHYLLTRGHKVDSSKQLKHEDLHSKQCWSCDFHVHKGGLVCRACDKIQPVEKEVNFFDLFDLPETFDVDAATLEKRYKSLQWQVHPDKTVSRTPKEQLFSAQQAAVLNHAYSILKAPLSRANYLLLRKGAARDEDEEQTLLDPELLGEVLERREEIEETSDPHELRSILSEVQLQESDLVAQLSDAFAQGDLIEAKALVTQLSYINKLVDAVVQKLP